MYHKHSNTTASTLRDLISPEFNLIKTADTIGGALIHLASLFRKIQELPTVNRIIALAETELAEEDRLAFENLEKAVAWFHAKMNILLPHVGWNPDSSNMTHINALLNFKTMCFNASGYVGSLHFALRRLYSEVAQKEDNDSLFEGWTKIEEGTGLRIFDWPIYVDKSLKLIPVEQQIYQWKERADTSFSCVLRFLKILSLYDSFVPLTLDPQADPSMLPQNLRELEERQCQAHEGFYLSLFGSHDSSKHPLSIAELIRLIDRFLYMIEQKLEDDQSPKTDSPQINIIINNFFFFTAAVENKVTVINPPPQEHAPVSPKTTSHHRSHPHTAKCNQDVKVLIPYAQEGWRKEVPANRYPNTIGKTKLAQKLLKQLPSHVSLHCKEEKRLARMVNAVRLTDPRIYDAVGNYKGLQPHWEKFGWVQ